MESSYDALTSRHLAPGYNRRQMRAAFRAGSPVSQPVAEPTDAQVERLMEHRILLVNGDIEEEKANQVTAQLLLLADANPALGIHLYINSSGGSVTAALAIYDTMKLVSAPVTTVGMGLAAGTAQLLLAAGERGKRFALPHARVWLTQPVGGAVVGTDELGMLARMRDEIARITAEDTGRSLDQVKSDAAAGRWFNAAEALEYGFVDHVVEKAPAPPL